jgi:HEAT repeat protein
MALLREGLDDPHPEVRAQAAAHLDGALIVVQTDVYLPKDKAAREELEKRREDYIDLIIDLAITKGLSDEDQDVQVQASVALESEFVKPTFRRVKCLERALAKNQVHPDVREVAESLRKKWSEAVNRQEPPWNRPPPEQ